ncbi:MAG: hypothetical protein ACK5MG_02375 [Bacteroidales bacterium]
MARMARDLSLIDLAARMIGEFDATSIFRIESRRTNLVVLTLLGIAVALEVPLK